MSEEELTPIQLAIDRLRDLMQAKIPEKIVIDVKTDKEKNLVKLINDLVDFSHETYNFILPLSKGDLSVKTPRTKNFFASPFKELHSQLQHLTWQAEQVASGNYNQRIDFMGDFSRAFNNMVEALDKKTRMLNEEIAERKKAEESLKEYSEKLEEANLTKDKFFSIISHDLRSPFSAIIGFANLLSQEYDSYDDNDRKEMVRNIEASANSAFRLLENLLDWSRSQINGIEYTPENLEVSVIAVDIINILAPQAARKNIKLLTEVKYNTKAYADPNMTKTILRNLISNAIKFTKKGGAVIISSKEVKPFLEITVKDSGIGIEKEDIGKIFKLGSASGKRGTAGEKGTGLGLMLCKEFTEKNGGNISIESEHDKGTTVKFTLPLHKS
jgi:signal transduction histidine kinase